MFYFIYLKLLCFLLDWIYWIYWQACQNHQIWITDQNSLEDVNRVEPIDHEYMEIVRSMTTPLLFYNGNVLPKVCSHILLTENYQSSFQVVPLNVEAKKTFVMMDGRVWLDYGESLERAILYSIRRLYER